MCKETEIREAKSISCVYLHSSSRVGGLSLELLLPTGALDVVGSWEVSGSWLIFL